MLLGGGIDAPDSETASNIAILILKGSTAIHWLYVVYKFCEILSSTVIPEFTRGKRVHPHI